MDTRFWGPSGWRLLHLIATAAPDLPEKELYTFFSTLPYSLPCKFCRASLSDYIQSDPVPQKRELYASWLYRIHNRVNGKLREQGFLNTKDPSWSEIKQQYKKMYTSSCTEESFIGWDFLYSTAYVTPCPSVQSSPMPNAPPDIKTPELRNRWSVMTREERIPYLEKWWNSLAKVLPFPRWRKVWKEGPIRPHTNFGRGPMTRWLYKMETFLCTNLRIPQFHNKYNQVCTELDTFSSNCGKQKVKVKTCRATKKQARKSLKVRRKNLYEGVGGFL